MFFLIDLLTCASSSLAEKLIVCISRRQPPPTYCPCWAEHGRSQQVCWGPTPSLPSALHPLAAFLSSSPAWLHSCAAAWLYPPCGQTGQVYENSKILTTRLYHRGNKTTARANDATTMLRSLDNTNTLKEQRLRLHLETCGWKTNWKWLQNLCVWRCRWAKSPFPSPQVHGSSNPLVFCFRLFGVSSPFLCSVSWKRAKWRCFCQFTPDRHMQMLQSLP